MKRVMVVIAVMVVVAAGFAFAAGPTFRVGFSAPYMDPPYDAAFWRAWDKLVKQAPYSDWQFFVTDAQSDLNNQLNQIEDLARKEPRCIAS